MLNSIDIFQKGDAISYRYTKNHSASWDERDIEIVIWMLWTTGNYSIWWHGEHCPTNTCRFLLYNVLSMELFYPAIYHLDAVKNIGLDWHCIIQAAKDEV